MKYLATILALVLSLSLGNEKERVKSCSLQMSKEELQKKELVLNCPELENETIIGFKFKVPKHKTVYIKGNTLNEEALNNLKASAGDHAIVIFDIEVKSGNKIEPILITVTD